MRAITLHQPYASLIVRGHKLYETRSWGPPPTLLGERIAIHAGKLCNADVREDILLEMDMSFEDAGLPFGAVVGSAKLENAGKVLDRMKSGALLVSWMLALPNVRSHNPYVYPAEQVHGDFNVGRWLWKMTEPGVKPFPVSCRGYQGFWRVPEGIE